MKKEQVLCACVICDEVFFHEVDVELCSRCFEEQREERKHEIEDCVGDYINGEWGCK